MKEAKQSFFLYVFALLISALLLGGCVQTSQQEKALEEAGVIDVERNSPESAAIRQFEIWVNVPYRNADVEVLESDGTFATVRLVAEFRESVEKDWCKKESSIQCRKVGKKWICDEDFIFSLYNFAPNSSFEMGTVNPLGWEAEMFRGKMEFIWDRATKRTGNYSLAITDYVPSTCIDENKQCAVGEWRMMDPIPIDITHSYQIFAWYRNTTQSSNVKLIFNLISETYPYPIGSTGLYQMSPTYEWKQHSYTVSSDRLNDFPIRPTHAYISIFASVETTDNGGVWIDDVSFVDIASSQ